VNAEVEIVWAYVPDGSGEMLPIVALFLAIPAPNSASNLRLVDLRLGEIPFKTGGGGLDGVQLAEGRSRALFYPERETMLAIASLLISPPPVKEVKVHYRVAGGVPHSIVVPVSTEESNRFYTCMARFRG
jgi:hypothetical protein